MHARTSSSHRAVHSAASCDGLPPSLHCAANGGDTGVRAPALMTSAPRWPLAAAGPAALCSKMQGCPPRGWLEVVDMVGVRAVHWACCALAGGVCGARCELLHAACTWPVADGTRTGSARAGTRLWPVALVFLALMLCGEGEGGCTAIVHCSNAPNSCTLFAAARAVLRNTIEIADLQPSNRATSSPPASRPSRLDSKRELIPSHAHRLIFHHAIYGGPAGRAVRGPWASAASGD